MPQRKLSRNTRAFKSGVQSAKAKIEEIHLHYLRDNALEFLQAYIEGLTRELKRRQAEWIKLKRK